MDFKDMLKEGAESAKGILKEGAESAKELGKDAKEFAEELVDKAEDVIEKVMTSYRDRAAAMYKMVGEGQMLAAFDTFYHDDVVMQEATGEVREGKAASRKFLEQWSETIQERHGGGVRAITSNEKEKVTMVEAWVDVTFKDGTRRKLEEVAVQHWDGDKIVRERFYYNAP